MNPHDASLHSEYSESMKRLFAEAKGTKFEEQVRELAARANREPPAETRMVEESADDKLARAAKKIDEALLRCPALPPSWPRFQIGETFHLKGMKFKVANIDASTVPGRLILEGVPRK